MANEQIHGHEVIEIVAAHPAGISADDLARRFAQGARFFTCSAEDMTLPELLSFLAARDKVELRGDLVFPGGAAPCDH